MRSAAAGLALLLAGCSLAPQHVRPELPAPSAWTPPDTTPAVPDATPGVRATEIGWRDFFADPRLEALIATALGHNRDLAVAVAQVEEARGLYGVQRADRLPTIGVFADGSRNQAAVTGPGGTTGRAILNSYDLGVGLSAFELDLWGRVRNTAAGARAQYLATAQAERAFRLALIREVATAYLTSVETGERIELAEATVQSRRDGLRIAQSRFEAGVTSELDLRQTASLVSQAETELANLRFAQALTDNALGVLLGGPLPAELPEPLPLAEQESPHAVDLGLPSDLLVARPDVAAAEEQLRGARANVGAARAAFLPAITLAGNYGWASTDLERLVGVETERWSYGASISLPLFTGGRLRSGLVAARAREDAAIAAYERAIQGAFQEVADALAGRRWLAEQVASQERGAAHLRAIAVLARMRYNEGVVSYLEVLDAERNLFVAEQALLRVRRAVVENLVALYVALGGGVIE